jgi:hypothetical protein
MAGVEIVTVRDRTDMDDFINLPRKVYRGDPNWVPPLRWHMRHLLDERRHPFWEFAERSLFLARRGGETVGRIAAIVDGNHNRYHNEKMGIWGFFEALDDAPAAAVLFDAAENWVRGKGMTFLRGPLNPSTNYEVGTLVEGFEYSPTVMMTYNPRYYPQLIEACGFRKEKDLLALLLEPDSRTSERVERLARRVLRNAHITIRPLNMRRLSEDAERLSAIYTESWAENWGFVPMSAREVAEMARFLRHIGYPELVFFIYYRDDPAGVVMILPDVNPLLKRLDGSLGLRVLWEYFRFRREVKGYRGVLFGIKKQYQRLGIPLVAFDHVNRMRTRRAFKFLEFGWNLEDNDAINQFDQEAGGRVYKRYRIYRRDLE